ncbi:phage tail protein [Tetragenococcus koreensis]|uniref:phage tail spike protein n=1 Tax=Tetragenococcus koreensis TaxID=290335 RepID=UPI001F3785A2|nr:phage tail spike protein [Tetragenococcus koreensis]MCF1585238.1 phage tail protein [Tetragenococcus koreensis]MCF1628786.1 phage tail protein [Tetragenococcus koreensis]
MYLVKIYNNQYDEVGTTIHSQYANNIKIEADSLKPDINDIGTFEFTIYPDNPGWGKIKPLKTLIKVTDTKWHAVLFEGRVLQPTTDQGDDRVLSESYLCEDEKAYLHDSIQSWKKFTGDRTGEQLFREALKVHNEQVEDYKKFEVGHIDMPNLSDNVRFIDDTSDTYDTITDKLLDNDNIGGEIRIRKEDGVRYLDWVQEVGEKKKNEIRLRKNLLEMTKELDPTEIVTKLFPRGERLEGNEDDEESQDQSKPRLTIADVNDGKEYLLADQELINEFGIQAKSETWDEVTQASNLLRVGKQFLEDQLVATGKFTIKALDLSLVDIDPNRFWIGNTYHVYNPLMSVDEDLRLVGITIKINEPEQTELDFGAKDMTLTEYQNSLTKEQRDYTDLQQRVEGQSRTIRKLEGNLGDTDQRVVDLRRQIDEGTPPDYEENINTILDRIQDLVGEIQRVSQSVPSDETMESIDSTLKELKEFQRTQEENNSMIQQRIEWLEEGNTGNG